MKEATWVCDKPECACSFKEGSHYSVPANRCHVSTEIQAQCWTIQFIKKARNGNFYETLAGFKCWQLTCFYLNIQLVKQNTSISQTTFSTWNFVLRWKQYNTIFTVNLIIHAVYPFLCLSTEDISIQFWFILSAPFKERCLSFLSDSNLQQQILDQQKKDM